MRSTGRSRRNSTGGVVPITRAADGTLALGGDGTPVEWAVEMRRFDETATLDHLADARQDRRRACGCARPRRRRRACACSAGRGGTVDRGAGRAMSSRTTPTSARRPSCSTCTAVDGDGRERAAPRSRAFVRCCVERGRLGLIRRCHGDLHLGNIVLIEGRPVLFDAIEFDPVIASGDVLYDLAFLLMDLIERGLGSDVAHGVLNRYLARNPARRRPRRARRAAAVSLAARGDPRQGDGGAARARTGRHDRSAQSARRYFDLAWRRAAAAATGADRGRRTVRHRQIAARARIWRLTFCHIQAPSCCARTSSARCCSAGMSRTKLPPEAYAPAVTRRVYATVIDKARRALAAGHSAIVDAVFASPPERAAVEQSAEALGVPFHGLFLTADLATRLRAGRIAPRRCQRRRCGGRRSSRSDYELGDVRLGAGRCLRHAGADAGAHAACVRVRSG